MTYGSLSDLTSITDTAGNTTRYHYDSAGNLLGIAYPDGTGQSCTYDPLGNPTQTTLQNGDPIRCQYNAQGLVTQANFADGTYQAFTYNTHGNLLTAKSYAAGGSLTGTTTLTYNAADELTSVSYPGGQSLTYSYNTEGQRTKSVDQSGYTLNYSYDALGRLAGLSDGQGMVVSYTYNNLGQLSEKENGNGTYTTYAYDAAGNLTREINYAPGGAVNSSFTYTYNALGETTSMTDADGNVTSYGYDPLGQLTQVNLPGGQTISYVYNAAGNRTEVINNGTATNYASNAANEITQVGSTTYAYDANGNLHTVTDSTGTTTYDYNDLDELVSITASNGTVTTFQYNPLGFLTGMTVNGTQTSYLVDPTGLGNVVASYNGSGSLIAHYNYGLGLVSQTGPSGTGYYDFDASANTIGITGSSGTYVNKYSYLPFGETTTVAAVLPNPFTFSGQAGVVQIGTSLFSMRARNYTPATGQFLSNDPAGLAGGDTNIRRYVGNSPTNAVDPLGLCELVDSKVGQWLLNDPMVLTKDQQWYLYATLAARYRQLYPVEFIGKNFSFFSELIVRDVTCINHILLRAQKIQAEREATANLLGPIDAGSMYSHTYFERPTYSQNYYYGPMLLGCSAPVAPFNPPPEQDSEPPGEWEYDPVAENDDDENEDSGNPNALDGPAGYGTQGFIQATGTLPYTIDFENDGSAATQDVIVAEQLDPNLQWAAFQLGSFGFGPVNVAIPAGLTQYQTTLSYQNTDGSSLNVQVSLDFNVSTGLLTATFVSLDPLAGQAPAGVFDGFLYPESESQVDSEGYVQYTVPEKAGLTTGTTINQQASVVFDTNASLNTAIVTNTIDAGPPTSSVAALPADSTSPFTVSWSGQSTPAARASPAATSMSPTTAAPTRSGSRPRRRLPPPIAARSATPTGSTAWPPTTSATSSQRPRRPRQPRRSRTCSRRPRW